MGGGYNPAQVAKYLAASPSPLLKERGWLWSFLSRIPGAILIGVLAGIVYLVILTRRPPVGGMLVLLIGWLLNVI